MKEPNDQMIENYIERVLALRQSQTLQQADLESLALELGMTADDIDEAKGKAQDHLSRGKSYLQCRRWDDAIEELKQAAALNPVDLTVLHALAEAYQSRYLQQRRRVDKDEAIVLAKQCLALKPDDLDAIARMNALDAPAGNRRSKALWIGGGAGIGLLGLLAGSTLLIGVNPKQQSLFSDNISLTTSSENSRRNITADQTSQVLPELDIPIEFDAPGLEIDPRLSRLNNYTDSSFYTLNGVLLNNGDQELATLRLKVDYLDAQGNILATESTEAVADNEAELRPGDTHAVNLLKKINPDLTQVRLSVVTQDQIPAASNYSLNPVVNYTWGFTKPANLDFSIAARTDQFKNYGSRAYHDAVFAITNTSEVAIKKLKLQIDFYDAQDQIIGSEDILVVYGNDAPMVPGEIRPKRSIHQAPETYASYRLTVLEAE